MTTTQILVGLGLAAFFVFGCFAMIFLDDLRHSISSIQANTRRIADNVAAPGEQVDHLIQEIRDEAELRRRDTQPEQSWPSKDRLDKPLSEYKDQAEITAEVAARLEKKLAEWPEDHEVSLGDHYHDDPDEITEEIVTRMKQAGWISPDDVLHSAEIEKVARKQRNNQVILYEVVRIIDHPQYQGQLALIEGPCGDALTLKLLEAGGTLSPVAEQRLENIGILAVPTIQVQVEKPLASGSTADQPASVLAHCLCTWDIVWEPQTMARVGDKMEGREGIVSYNADCPIHGHRSSDSRREDQ